MKWLILTEGIDLNNTSSGICNSNIINALYKLGNKITVVYPQNPDVNPIWLEGPQLIAADLYSPLPWYMHIPKLPGLYTVFTGFHFVKRNLINKWKETIKSILKKERFDVVLLLGSGFSFAPYLAMHELQPPIKWIANIHDPYPLFELPPPFGVQEKFYMKKEATLFKAMCASANGLVFPSLELREWMRRFNPAIQKKGIVIPHPGKIVSNLTDNKNDLSISLEKGKFNLLHAGSLLGSRDPRPLLTAFRLFLEKNPDAANVARISIIGHLFKEHKDMEKVLHDFKDQVAIIPRISYKRIYDLLRQSDANIIIEAKTEISPFLPGKFSDYITANRPIVSLSPKKSEVRRLLGADNPYCTENGNIEETERIITNLYLQWKKGHIALNYDDRLRNYIDPVSVAQSFQKLASEI